MVDYGIMVAIWPAYDDTWKFSELGVYLGSSIQRAWTPCSRTLEGVTVETGHIEQVIVAPPIPATDPVFSSAWRNGDTVALSTPAIVQTGGANYLRKGWARKNNAWSPEDSPVVTHDAAWLLAQLTIDLGGAPALLALAKDVTLSGSNVETIVVLAGGTNFVANNGRFYVRTIAGTTLTELYSPDGGATPKRLDSTTAVKDIIITATTSALPVSETQILVSASSEGNVMTLSAGTSAFAASAGITYLRNGLVAAPTAGVLCAYEAVKSTSWGDYIKIGGFTNDGTTPWLGGFGTVVFGVNFVMTDVQRSDVLGSIALYLEQYGGSLILP
jgi:hypothetical protein